jgi:hypothetical protein
MAYLFSVIAPTGNTKLLDLQVAVVGVGKMSDQFALGDYLIGVTFNAVARAKTAAAS